MKHSYVVLSPRCTDRPLATFSCEKDAQAFYKDMCPTRTDAHEQIFAVQHFDEGYLGCQRRKDRRS